MSKYLFRVYLIFLNFVFALSCDPGYIEVEGFCINISNCPTNCLSCQISTTCDTCLPGYYLQVSAFFTKCEACSDGCKVCSSNNNCSICFPNYYISGLICQPCPIYNYKNIN